MLEIPAQHVKVVEDNNEAGHPVGTKGILIDTETVNGIEWCLVLASFNNSRGILPLWHFRRSLKFGAIIDDPRDMVILEKPWKK